MWWNGVCSRGLYCCNLFWSLLSLHLFLFGRTEMIMVLGLVFLLQQDFPILGGNYSLRLIDVVFSLTFKRAHKRTAKGLCQKFFKKLGFYFFANLQPQYHLKDCLFWLYELLSWQQLVAAMEMLFKWVLSARVRQLEFQNSWRLCFYLWASEQLEATRWRAF